MKLGEDHSEYRFVKLTVDEEYAMAQWVMDVLCLEWVETRDSFNRFLWRLFEKKCKGADFYEHDLMRLWEFGHRYTKLLPTSPELKNNNTATTAPAKHSEGTEYTFEEKAEYIKQTVCRAWREVWEKHKIKQRHDLYIFPGEEPGPIYYAHMAYLEDAFWTEVDMVQDRYDCSRSEAIIIASDYMKRPPDGPLRQNPDD